MLLWRGGPPSQSNLGHSSIIFMIECQVNYICQLLGRLVLAPKGTSLTVKPSVVTAFDDRMQRLLVSTPWGRGCNNWWVTVPVPVVARLQV
jgi:hypothetical protein